MGKSAWLRGKATLEAPSFGPDFPAPAPGKRPPLRRKAQGKPLESTPPFLESGLFRLKKLLKTFGKTASCVESADPEYPFYKIKRVKAPARGAPRGGSKILPGPRVGHAEGVVFDPWMPESQRQGPSRMARAWGRAHALVGCQRPQLPDSVRCLRGRRLPRRRVPQRVLRRVGSA